MRLKFGDKVIIKDRSALDGVEGVVYRIDGEKISVLLDKEVIWPVDHSDLEQISVAASTKLPSL